MVVGSATFTVRDHLPLCQEEIMNAKDENFAPDIRHTLHPRGTEPIKGQQEEGGVG